VMNCTGARRAVSRRGVLGILLGGALLLPSSLTATHANAEGQHSPLVASSQLGAEDLGAPVSVAGVLDNALGRDADGDLTLYGTTYSKPNDATFFAVDPMTGSVKRSITG
jgi:hypothetical protein